MPPPEAPDGLACSAGAVDPVGARSGGGAMAVVCGEESPADKAEEELGSVRKIFEIAGLDAGVALYSSREEALSHLSAAT